MERILLHHQSSAGGEDGLLWGGLGQLVDPGGEALTEGGAQQVCVLGSEGGAASCRVMWNWTPPVK
jgi:hypothetical protein